jgi:hypothetical protein
MERLKELMSQLKEQFDRGGRSFSNARTAQLLEEEIRLLASKPAPAKVMPTKIAVMMPSAVKIVAPPIPEQEPTALAPSPRRSPPRSGQWLFPNASAINGAAIPSAVNGAPAVNGTPLSTEPPPFHPYANGNAAAPILTRHPRIPPYAATAVPIPLLLPARPLTTRRRQRRSSPGRTPERGTWPFDPLAEKPIDRFTLSQKTREINDVIGTNGTSSLNEKLKSDIRRAQIRPQRYPRSRSQKGHRHQ